MRARQITTAHDPVTCEICRRTLLRGELPVGFLVDRRKVSVCELCEPRALQEGWLREGAEPEPEVAARRRERRSLLRRLRGEAPAPARRTPPAGGLSDDREERRPAVKAEERNVHGVPASVPLKVERAIEMFNASGLPHRMAGICRSLGAPVVSVRPSPTEGGIVRITIAWELAWYRFEADLGDEAVGVRPVARGNELRELAPDELEPTNALDDDGRIVDAAA